MYNPDSKTKEILDVAMGTIKSVPYAVSLRWVFYQIVQRHGVQKSYWDSFKKITSRARKNFYGEWNPGTTQDSVRDFYDYAFPRKARKAVSDHIEGQKNYVEIWFEARAMLEQFIYHTRDYRANLLPFGGDVSIPIKWDTAMRFRRVKNDYKLPIVVLYFGDLDKKGEQIRKVAEKDIRKWANVNFKLVYCGLTASQAKGFKIPENPEKPGEYQWEALSDEHAKEMIVGNLKKVWKAQQTKRTF